MSAAKKKKAPKKKAPKQEAETEEAASPAAKPKKTKKGNALSDNVAAFLAKSQKTWPDCISAASELQYQEVPKVSTGNVGVDIATFRGFPRGRIVRVFGREKSAKTGTCLNTVAEWQKHCGCCYERWACHPSCDYHGDEENRPSAYALWIDAEHRLESMWHWVTGHGVNLDHLIYQIPPSGQHIVDFTGAAIREKGAGIGLIVVDSLAHITAEEEIKKATTKGKTAPVNALLLNRALRLWSNAVCALGLSPQRKPMILLINQLRDTMDQYHPEVTPCGKGQDYATALDLRLAHGKKHYILPDKDGNLKDYVPSQNWKPPEDAIPDYVEIKYRVTQSGVCPSGRYGEFRYWLRNAHGRRIGDPDNRERLWEYAKRYTLWSKTGRNLDLFGVTATTQDALKVKFYESPEVQEAVREAILKMLVDDAT